MESTSIAWPCLRLLAILEISSAPAELQRGVESRANDDKRVSQNISDVQKISFEEQKAGDPITPQVIPDNEEIPSDEQKGEKWPPLQFQVLMVKPVCLRNENISS